MAEGELPGLARVIRVERSPRGRARVLVDGAPLPWLIAEPVTTEITDQQAPGVTFTVLAERVEVIDAYLDGGLPGDPQGAVSGVAELAVENHAHDHLQEQVDTETRPSDIPADTLGGPGHAGPTSPTRPEEVLLDLDADPDDAEELARHEKLRERVISEVLSGQRPKARLKADH